MLKIREINKISTKKKKKKKKGNSKINYILIYFIGISSFFSLYYS
jgi:hypothetical protein